MIGRSYISVSQEKSIELVRLDERETPTKNAREDPDIYIKSTFTISIKDRKKDRK